MLAFSTAQRLRTRAADASFFFQAEDGIRDDLVTGVQTCALPIFISSAGLIGPGVPWAGPVDDIDRPLATGLRHQHRGASGKRSIGPCHEGLGPSPDLEQDLARPGGPTGTDGEHAHPADGGLVPGPLTGIVHAGQAVGAKTTTRAPLQPGRDPSGTMMPSPAARTVELPPLSNTMANRTVNPYYAAAGGPLDRRGGRPIPGATAWWWPWPAGPSCNAGREGVMDGDITLSCKGASSAPVYS